MSPASLSSMEAYLFGEKQAPVKKSLLKPLSGKKVDGADVFVSTKKEQAKKSPSKEKKESKAEDIYTPEELAEFKKYDIKPSGEPRYKTETLKMLEEVKKEGSNLYFNEKPGAQVMALADIQPRNPITTIKDRDKLARGIKKMASAKDGTGEKRDPITVFEKADGMVVLLDGNTTYHGLKSLGEQSAIVTVIKDRPLQQTDSIEELYKQSKEARPLAEKLTKDIVDNLGGALFLEKTGL